MCNIAYNTPFNTVGIGDPVPYGGCVGIGSGDRFDNIISIKGKKKIYSKKPVKNIFDYTNPQPLLVKLKNKR